MILHSIYGERNIGTVWRRKNNEEVLNMYGEPTRIDIIKAQIVRLLGYVEKLS